MERRIAQTDARRLVTSRSNVRKTYRKLAVLCPQCNVRLTDISAYSGLVPYMEDDEEAPEWEPEAFLKCGNCHKEVYLYKVLGRPE